MEWHSGRDSSCHNDAYIRGGGTAVTALAADNASITITITNTDDSGAAGDDGTYKAYQIFKGDVYTDESGNKILSNVTKGDGLSGTDALITALLADNALKDKEGIKDLKSGDSAATIAEAIAKAGITSETFSSGSVATHSTDAEALAAVLNSVKTGDGIEFTKDGSSFKASNLAPGYYLVTSANGSRLILGVTDVTVNEKNEYPTVDKKQKKDGSESDYTDDEISQEIGKVVDYQVEVKIPATANKAITVTDIVSKGLTMNTASGSVTGTVTAATLGESFSAPETVANWTKSDTNTSVFTGSWSAGVACQADGTVAEGDGADEKNVYTKYTLTIPENLVQAIAATYGTSGTAATAKFTLTYTATVNEKAVSKTADTNKATIDYEKYHQEDTEVKVTTYGFKVLKYDGSIIKDDKTVETLSDSDVLAGAVFELYRDEDCTDKVSLLAENSTDYQYRVVTAGTENAVTSFTTVKDHQTEIRGLDTGVTYYLKETTPPAGFNTISPNPVQVNNVTNQATTVMSTTNDVVTKIENNKGTVLPSTGGIGTTIFYVIGGALIAGAAVLLVLRRKRA